MKKAVIKSSFARDARNKQRGAAELQQLIIATALALLIGVGAYVYIPGIIIESRITDVARDFQRFTARARTMGQGGGATPYTDVTTAQLANAMRAMRSSVFEVAGTGAAATVSHTIGASGAQVTLGPGTVNTAGDAMTVTWNDVALEGCVPLAQVLQGESQTISINGTAVKTTTAGTPSRFNLTAAESACSTGDTNDIVFVLR